MLWVEPSPTPSHGCRVRSSVVMASQLQNCGPGTYFGHLFRAPISVLLIFAHVSLTFFNINALTYVALICLGIAFSLVPAAMWPSVAKIVPESRLGTAYATMFTVQNWGLALFYWLPGQLLKSTDSNYTIAFAPFVILGFVSIACAIQLGRSDKNHGYGLELPSGELPPEVTP